MIISFQVYGQNQSTISFSDLETLFEKGNYDSIIKIDENQIVGFQKSSKGDFYEIYAYTFEALNRDDQAFEFFKKAKDFYISQNQLEKVAKINSAIFNLLDSKKTLKIDKNRYLQELKAYAQSANSQKWMMRYYNNKGVQNFDSISKDSARIYFLKARELAVNLDSLKAIYQVDINLGALHLTEFKRTDSAIYYYENALKAYNKDGIKEDNNLFALYNNIGKAYSGKKDFSIAETYYKKAEKIDLKRYNDLSKRILFNNMEVNYYYMNDFENAYNYLYKYDSINEIIKLNEQNTNIKDIEEKYQNEKLRADNLESEAKRIQNRNIAFGLGGSIALGLVIIFLAYKNINRKQKLIKQEQTLKTQKLTNQLKEEELKSIDAMISGQEKERLRIANDLHDDLGSLMATIKMHFGTFKDQTSDNLYKQTNNLIDEAYQKIRNIAHAKNSGVLAKEGLLKAVKKLAKTISASENLKISVYENGLDQRLENSLELTLFRIIQELVTNVLKHAKATEVDIHINQHKNKLNIMIEDNGKGFNPDQITKTNPGMGLSSIDKRIEHLEGNMVIESKPNNGTSVIIDLPI